MIFNWKVKSKALENDTTCILFTHHLSLYTFCRRPALTQQAQRRKRTHDVLVWKAPEFCWCELYIAFLCEHLFVPFVPAALTEFYPSFCRQRFSGELYRQNILHFLSLTFSFDLMESCVHVSLSWLTPPPTGWPPLPGMITWWMVGALGLYAD